MTPRRLVRYFRVVVACLALAVAWPSLAAAAPSADAVAWVAGARASAAVEAAIPESAVGLGRVASPSARKNDRRAPGAPAGARAIVISSQLYLRHEALLR
jgi:hypothetical protein